MRLTCIIADDEPLARKVLVEHIDAIADLHLAHQCKNGLELRLWLEDNAVDLAFVDINMPKLSGLEVLRSLQQSPLVVLTTAYSEHAVEAFELDAFDYLVKPISFERFFKAVAKAKKSLREKAANRTAWITIKEGRRLYKVDPAHIRYLQAYGDYVRIFALEMTYITKRRLTQISQGLPPDFLQVHRSYVVNLSWVEYLEGNHLMIGKDRIPVSSTFRDELLSRLH